MNFINRQLRSSKQIWQLTWLTLQKRFTINYYSQLCTNYSHKDKNDNQIKIIHLRQNTFTDLSKSLNVKISGHVALLRSHKHQLWAASVKKSMRIHFLQFSPGIVSNDYSIHLAKQPTCRHKKRNLIFPQKLSHSK